MPSQRCRIWTRFIRTLFLTACFEGLLVGFCFIDHGLAQRSTLSRIYTIWLLRFQLSSTMVHPEDGVTFSLSRYEKTRMCLLSLDSLQSLCRLTTLWFYSFDQPFGTRCISPFRQRSPAISRNLCVIFSCSKKTQLLDILVYYVQEGAGRTR